MANLSFRLLRSIPDAKILSKKCFSTLMNAPSNVLSNKTFEPIQEFKRHKILRRIFYKTWPIDKLPVEWQKPPVKDCIFDTGDKVTNLGEVDLSQPKPFFEDCPELEEADELVKKVFTLHTADKHEIIYQLIRQAVAKFQRHPYDMSSADVKVAVCTIKIRSLQEYFATTEEKHQSVRLKRQLVHYVGRRLKYLNQLRKFDRERFNYLVSELGIEFEEQTQETNPRPYTRKSAIKKLVLEHCETQKQKKLESYRSQLEAQREQFLAQREETLNWIAEQEKILEEYEKRN